MSENPHSAELYGFALDALVISAMTLLTALRVADVTLFLAVVGPMVGARLAALRHARGGGPPDQGAGGSAALSLVFALALLFRRPTAVA